MADWRYTGQVNVNLPSTERGRATRARIVRAAIEAIAERGASRLNLDDVIVRAGASKGQLYHYFDDREALLHAAVRETIDEVVTYQHGIMQQLDSWDAIRAWFDCLVEVQETVDARGGCPLAMLAAHLVEQDEVVRAALLAGFEQWEQRLEAGLMAMQARGELVATTDAGRLATASMASIQGGLLLTQVRRDSGQLRIALDAAWSHLRSHATADGDA